MKKKYLLILVLFLRFNSTFSQSKFYIWDQNGNYIFNEGDSNLVITHMKKLNSNYTNVFSENGSPIYYCTYFVLFNPKIGIEYEKLKIKIKDGYLFNCKTDSCLYTSPYCDSLPDGKWGKFYKFSNDSVSLKSIKEIKNGCYVNIEYVFPDDLSAYISNYKFGYRTGKTIHKYKDQVIYECQYKDSLNFIIYEKAYSIKGQLLYCKDYNKLIYSEYQNGRIYKECHMDLYGNLLGLIKIYKSKNKQ